MLPTECGGCGQPGERWCAACATSLDDVHLRTLDGPVPLAVGSAGVYRERLADAVNAWKDRDRADLTGPFARALSGALAAVDPGGRSALVPVPSTRAARRRRGRVPVAELCRAVRPRRLVLPALAVRPVLDQSGLTVQERAENLRGAVRVRWGWHGELAGRRVVLVDDVVTSGATLREAAAVLVGAGAHVVAAATVASTPRLGRAAAGPDGTDRCRHLPSGARLAYGRGEADGRWCCDRAGASRPR